MNTFLGLCCAACVGVFDPTAAIDSGLRGDLLIANSFMARTTELVGEQPVDGFWLDEGRIALSGGVGDRFAAYAGLGADNNGLATWEAYGDLKAFNGLAVRGGRWITQLGAVSGRRTEGRCFTDVPLHTERFLGRRGLYDAGLQISYTVPLKRFPILLSVSAMSGQEGLSFQQPAGSGEGAAMLERLLYVVRLAIAPGALFGQHLTAGVTFASGQNDTGPGNRTDLIGFDVSGAFKLGNDVVLGTDLEFLMRRYGVPFALLVEGGMSLDLVAGWRGLHGGVRLDLMGVPRPPTREELEWRVSVAAGYDVWRNARFRFQYSARNDTPDAAIAHEFVLQAILNLGAEFITPDSALAPESALAIPQPSAPRHSTLQRPAVVLPPAHNPPESKDPADWLAAASEALAVARTLSRDGHHSAAAAGAQMAAYQAVRAVGYFRRIAAPAGRGVTTVVEKLGHDGNPPPGPIWAAAHELDRHYAAARYPSELGGPPSRYYDRPTGNRALVIAESVLTWARQQLAPPASPSEPAPTEPSPSEAGSN